MKVIPALATPSFATNHNYLHALSIGPNGQLTEPTEPVQPPVPATARPQGAVSVTF